MRCASSRPIARPSPKPDVRSPAAPRSKRPNTRERSPGARPAPRSATRRTACSPVRLDRRRDRAAAGRVAQGVVEQDAEDPRDGGLVAERGHGRAAVAGERGLAVERDVALAAQLDPGLAGARLELGLHGGRDVAQVDRLAAQRDLAVEPAEVEQVGREPGQPAGLAAGGRRAAAGVVDVRDRRRERLVHELDRRLQERQRRAQLVRRGAEEGLAGALLGLQARAHGLERAREVADLVVRAVAREGLADVALPQASGALAQALEAPQQAEAQHDAEEQRDRQPGDRRERQRAAHDRDRRPAVVQRLGEDERDRAGVGGHASRRRSRRSRGRRRGTRSGPCVLATGTRSSRSAPAASDRVGVRVLQRRAARRRAARRGRRSGAGGRA